jgi:hypothetical protein
VKVLKLTIEYLKAMASLRQRLKNSQREA